MENVKNLKRIVLYFGLFFLSIGLNSCSDDDDDEIVEMEPTGAIVVEDDQTVTNNTIMVQSVIVGQNSWLVAVMSGEENTNNFITEPVMVQEGTASDIQLTLNENAPLEGDTDGTEVSLKLYADNPDEGTSGEWDEFDEPIRDENDVLVTETFTVFSETSGTAAFSDFDQNQDQMLDANEVPNIYADNFAQWDADSDGSLSEAEFYNTGFGNTDADDDTFVSQEEWNVGYASMYNPYIADDFATFDSDADGFLSNDEWNTAFADSTWFSTYDADADTFVAESEWDSGVFTDWDTNADTFIDETEFNAFSPYVGAW